MGKYCINSNLYYTISWARFYDMADKMITRTSKTDILPGWKPQWKKAIFSDISG